jgi:hypothetical protein
MNIKNEYQYLITLLLWMNQYGEILYHNVVVTRLENERPIMYTQETTIVEQINVAMVVQTQEKDVNVLLDIGRKGVLLIIGLVIHNAKR